MHNYLIITKCQSILASIQMCVQCKLLMKFFSLMFLVQRTKLSWFVFRFILFIFYIIHRYGHTLLKWFNHRRIQTNMEYLVYRLDDITWVSKVLSSVSKEGGGVWSKEKVFEKIVVYVFSAFLNESFFVLIDAMFTPELLLNRRRLTLESRVPSLIISIINEH